jgi:p-hydroxybenzoate 3-monooxygenase
MQREGMFHNGVYFAFGGALHHINFRELVGKGVTIYGQQEVVKDLVARRLADGGEILFEAADVSVHDFDGKTPKVRFHHEGRAQELACDFIGGCHGFHGICRPSIPHVLTAHDREYRSAGSGSSRIAAARGRAHLRLSRPRLCAVHHALADPGAALLPMRAR